MDLIPEIAAFERWWHEEGSGMPPLDGEDAETHVHRVSRIAWLVAVGVGKTGQVAEGRTMPPETPAEVEEAMKTWYLLFDGSSVDGRGEGTYVGRTTDREAARKHYVRCAKDPYSTGRVDIVTDTKLESAWSDTDWQST
jgi:hypothetical protein